MTLWTAAWLFVVTVIGIILVWKYLRVRRALRITCIVLLSLAALILAVYYGLCAIFIDAIRHQ